MPKRSPSTLKEKVPPEQRLAMEQEAKINMEVARKLLKEKKYKESFKQFKHALAAADGTNIFPSSAEMATLTKNYRPALVALKRWRAQKEQLILTHSADSTVISQWNTLNDSLKEKDRFLKVFRKLQAAGADKDLLRSFYWKIWQKLVKGKQYEDLRQFFGTLGWMTLLNVSEHHAQKWFPREKTFARTPAQIIEEGALVYETAVALHEVDAANVIMEKLLSVEETDMTYAALITAARRACGKEQAKSLFQQARERLGARRIRKSTKALGPLVRALAPSSRARGNQREL